VPLHSNKNNPGVPSLLWLPVRSHFKAFRTFAEFERNGFCLTSATSEMPGA